MDDELEFSEAFELAPDQVDWLLGGLNKIIAAQERKIDAVQKLIEDAEEVYQIMPNQTDRIWIDAVRTAWETP